MKKVYTLIILLLASSYIFAQKDYEGYVKDALDYTEAKEYAAAELSYKAALRAEPANAGNVMLFMNLGTIQRYLEKYQEALESYNMVVARYPTLSYILKSRALLYCDMKRYEDAIKDYSTVILHNPEDKDALYERGLVYFSMKDMDAADGDFKKILIIDSKDYRGKLGIAMVMKRKGEWKEAEEVYTELISEYKEGGILYANRAETYLNLKKLKNMKEDLDKAIEYGYKDISVYILKGQYHLEQYDKIAAKQEFIKAKEMGAEEDLVNQFLELCK